MWQLKDSPSEINTASNTFDETLSGTYAGVFNTFYISLNKIFNLINLLSNCDFN